MVVAVSRTCNAIKLSNPALLCFVQHWGGGGSKCYVGVTGRSVEDRRLLLSGGVTVRGMIAYRGDHQ